MNYLPSKIFALVIFAVVYLPTTAQQPRLVLPIGHSGFLGDIQCTNDGKYFVTTSQSNNDLKLWEITTGKLLGTYSGHIKGIRDVVFSKDDKLMISASADSTIRIWETKTFKSLHVLKGHKGDVWTAMLSKDGKKLYSSSDDSTIKVWDVATGKLLQSKNMGERIYSTYANNSTTRLVNSASYGNKMVVKDIASLQSLFTLQHIPETYINGIVFSHNDALIASLGDDGVVNIWSSTDGKLLFALKGHSKGVATASFSKDDRYLLTWSNDRSVKLWDVTTGKLVRNIGTNGRTNWASISNNDKMIAAGVGDSIQVSDLKTGAVMHYLHEPGVNMSFGVFDPTDRFLVNATSTKMFTGKPFDYRAMIWSMKSGKLLYDMANHSFLTSKLKFTPDGKTLAAVTHDWRVKMYETNTARLSNVLAGHRDYISDIDFSKDGKYIATASQDITAKIWDAATGNVIHPILRHPGAVTSVVFNSDGKKILTATTGTTKHHGLATIWGVDTGNALLDLTGHEDWVLNACFSKDDHYIATTSIDNTVKIWDYKNAKFLYSLPEKTFITSKGFASFSSDNKFILTFATNDEYSAKIWDMPTGKMLHRLWHPGLINSARISHNDKLIASATSYAQKAFLWDAATGKIKFTLNGHTGNISDAIFSDDDSKLVTISDDHTAKVWSTATGKMMFDLKGHTDRLLSATFDSASTRLVTSSADNTNKVWDLKTGKEIYTFVSIDSSDYFVQIPEGYYMASPNAVKLLHYVTKDLKVITFQQLDVRYNRPDKVLEAIGCTDKKLINSYRKAYQKRVKKLGIDTTSFRSGFSVPEADFVNRETISYEQSNGELKVKIKGADKDFKLDRMNVWVNEVPLFGLKGISVRGKNSNSIDTSITIPLSKGENIIEASITNVNGTESYRIPLQVKYGEEDTRQQKVYFVGIGINEFQQPENNLQWSVKDIKDLAAKLKSRYGNNLTVDTLFDKNVTRENILAIKSRLQKLSVDDKVIISYSGHGVLSKELDYYLSTYSINFDKPETAGLSYDDLESLLDNIKPRKKLMLIDACHSGEVDKDEVARIEASKKTLDTSGINTKGKVIVKQKKSIGMVNSFELMKDLFVNVGKGTGATIISAAGGMQYAQERGDLKNGVFTYSIIQAFNQNKSLKVSQLRSIVGANVLKLTNGLQKPTSRNETNVFDWFIW